MTLQERAATGWRGLVRRLGEAKARQAVADLGRARYYADTRPEYAAELLARHEIYRNHVSYNLFTKKPHFPCIGSAASRLQREKKFSHRLFNSDIAFLV